MVIVKEFFIVKKVPNKVKKVLLNAIINKTHNYEFKYNQT
jgi:hypothetical protein